jgi:general secretion pathway protein M
MKEALRQWWTERSPRERVIVAAGASLVAALVLFLFVYEPIDAERLRLRERVPQLKLTLQKMQAQAEQVKSVQSRPKSASLEVALKETAAQSGLANANIALDGPDRARVSFASVEFNRWIQWTGRLQTERAIRIESAQVEALREPGMAKINALLASSAGK